MSKIPNMQRTSDALDVYDALDSLGSNTTSGMTAKDYESHLTRLELFADEVRACYIADTADRNLASAAPLVEIGTKNPQPGYGESQPRRMVRLWRERHPVGKNALRPFHIWRYPVSATVKQRSFWTSHHTESRRNATLAELRAGATAAEWVYIAIDPADRERSDAKATL